jgi:hypothetical protein
MTSQRFVVLSLLVAVLAGMGCGPATGAGTPSAITCHTQYRPDAETLTGSSEPSVTVQRADGVAARPERLDFATLTVEVAFHGDAPEGRKVTIAVMTTAGEPLVRNLYQLTDGTELTTDFAGGHGFTGLQYVFHEGSALQVWCESGDA